MKFRSGLLSVALVALLVAPALSQRRGRVDISPPVYQLFTVTDWVDVTRLALKTTIPGGISGSLYASTPGNVALTGEIFKRGKNDPAPISLGTFFTDPFSIDAPSANSTYPFQYTLTMGDLAAGSTKIDVTFTESPDYQKFKDEIAGGASANIAGSFAVSLRMHDGTKTGTELARWDYTWNVPFASEENARISFVGQTPVTTPTPQWTVIYPAETPDLPIEAWVVKVENNSVDAALEGRKYVLFKPQPGTFLLQYPPDAPVLTPGNYAIGGRSIISTSSGLKSVSAIPFEFKVEEPSTSTGSGGNNSASTGGSTVTIVDPLVTVFGNYATSIPQNFAARLTPNLRALMENTGWTFTSIRFNGRTITASEMISENVLATFGSNWNMYLVQ